LDIEKAFHTTRHFGVLYKLSELKFSLSLIKLISSFLSQRKFRVSVEGEMFTSGEIQERVPHCAVNDTPQTPGVYLGLFADDTCIYATDSKEGYVLRKLQRGLSALETWCERWKKKE
jgi:hypothetical protein